MSREILLHQRYRHAPELVWEVLTDPTELAAWLMPNDFVAEVGRPFTMTTRPRPGFNGVIDCRVLELSPPRVMRWSWRSGVLDSEVTFELEPDGGGTRLTLRQTGFQGLRLLVPWAVMRAGWQKKIFTRLGTRLGARDAVGPKGSSAASAAS